MKKAFFLISLLLCFKLIFPQEPNCNAFKNGYKDISWRWSVEQVKQHFIAKGFSVEDYDFYKDNSGNKGINITFRKGNYYNFKSNREHFYKQCKFLNGRMFSIYYESNFNWNYNYNDAREIAKDVANKYNIPLHHDKEMAFGGRNTAWHTQCGDLNVLLGLTWIPHVIEGETTRYLYIELTKLKEENIYNKVMQKDKKIKRQQKNKDFSKPF